jgi:WD40 repeat protein/serine/threonine protein kinase
MSVQADDNLLFGFLALQNNFLSREDLIAAVSAWLVDKSRPLDQILRERKSLSDEEHALIAALARKHVERHGGNAEKSLAALSAAVTLRKDLERLNDVDIAATLDHISHQRQADSDCSTTLPNKDFGKDKTRFRILRPHAEGGLGQVYVARDEELNREVALKEIKLLRSDDPANRSRFMLEAEITGGLEHPGIVPVYSLGQYSDGRPFYAMRFIRGDSLAEAADHFHAQSVKHGNYESVEFRKLLGRFVDVCNAIEYAHSRGVLHRDLKPGNIMLGKYGETLVVDWGLAKVKGRDEQHLQLDEDTLQPRSDSGEYATLLGSAIGTPAFMSPEQAGGRLHELGPATDVYSLGATLYYVLAGKTPFIREETGVLLRKVQRGEFMPPRAIKPQVPAALEAICLKAMKREPHERYVSPQELGEDVERFLADETVIAYQEPWKVRARRWLRKHPGISAAVAATLFVGIVSAGLLSFVVGQKNTQLADANGSLSTANAKLSRANEAERAAAETARQAKSEAETKQQEAERARQEEQVARKQAESAQQQAETARQDLATEADRSRHALYARTVSLAQQEWMAGNVLRASDLLSSIDATQRGWEWCYLQRLCDGGSQTLHGMTGFADNVAITPDGQHVVAAGLAGGAFRGVIANDPNIYVWRRSDGAVVAKHSGRGTISPDGRFATVYSGPGTIKVVESVTGKLVGTVPIGTTEGAFSRSGKRLAVQATDLKVRVYDIGNDEPVAVISGAGKRRQHSLALDANGDRVAWRRMEDGVLEWYDVSRPEEPLCRVELGAAFPSDLSLSPAFSPNGKLIAVAVDRQIALYDTTTGQSRGTLSGHQWYVSSLDFSPDSSRLVSASMDATIRLWDVQRGREIVSFKGHRVDQSHGVSAAAFDSTGNWIVSSGLDSTVKLWDAWAGDVDPSKSIDPPLDSNRWLRSPVSQETDWLTGHTNMVLGLAQSPDGQWLATASIDGTVRVQPTPGLEAVELNAPMIFKHAPVKPLGAVAFSNDGAWLATGAGWPNDRAPGEVWLWELAAGKLCRKFQDLQGPVARLAFAGQKNVLIIAVGSGVVTQGELLAWDVASNQVIWRKKAAAIRDLSLSARENQVVTVGHDGKAHIWDLATGEQLHSWGQPGRNFLAVAYSPDGKQIAVGGRDASIRMFSAADGRELWAQRHHAREIFDVCFNSDGSRLVSTSIDGVTRVWDTAYGDETLSLPSVGSENIAVVFDSEQNLLVGGAYPEIAIHRPAKNNAVLDAAAREDWKVVFSDDFERGELGDRWKKRMGKWQIENGALKGTLQDAAGLQSGGRGFQACTVIPNIIAPSQIDISLDAWTTDAMIGEIKLHDSDEREGLGALFIGKPVRYFNHGEQGGSLIFQAGGTFKEFNVRQQGFTFEPGRKYRLRSIRRGDHWQMWIDGVLYLETQVSPSLALPFVHLQGSFGDLNTTWWIDNVEIRVPESAMSEQRALAAVDEAFQKHKVSLFARDALDKRSDLSAEEQQLVTKFAKQRLMTNQSERQALWEWTTEERNDARLARLALDWLGEQTWTRNDKVHIQRLRAGLLYRSGDFDGALQAARVAASQYRQDFYLLHPLDMAIQGLLAHRAGQAAEARRFAASARELLRSDNWGLKHVIERWQDEVREAGLLPNIAGTVEEDLLEKTWELRRRAQEDSDPEPIIALLTDDAKIVRGRWGGPGKYDSQFGKKEFAAVQRLWHLGKPSPATKLVRESAEVKLKDNRAVVETHMVWTGNRHFVEIWEFVKQGGEWRINKLETFTSAYSLNGKWHFVDAGEEGWQEVDKAVENAPADNWARRFDLLVKAGREPEAFEEAKRWVAEEPKNASVHAELAYIAFCVGDAAAMEAAARQSAELDPANKAGIRLIRAIATESQLAPSPVTVFGKTLQVPKTYASLQPSNVIGAAGKVLGAWNPDKQSVILLYELPKNGVNATRDQVISEFNERMTKNMKAQVVCMRKIRIADREAFDATYEGRGTGLLMLPVLTAGQSISTSQQLVAFDEGERYLCFLLSCPSQALDIRTTELSVILKTVLKDD